MELWQQILALILTPTAVLAVIVYLAKTYLSSQVSKDIENFKAQLERSLIEYGTRFSLIREKEAEVVGTLYAKIARTASKMASLVHIFQPAGGPTLNEKKREVADIAQDMADYFNEHRIYFDDQTCEAIDGVNKLMHSAFVSFDMSQQGEEYQPDTTGMWKEAYEKLNNEWPNLKQQLRDRFREILYGHLDQEKKDA